MLKLQEYKGKTTNSGWVSVDEINIRRMWSSERMMCRL